MKMQNDADAIIKAYDVCKSQLAVLEKEHGYITSMQQTADGYIWQFVDRTTARLDKDGNIV